jgi:hypothetical protein
MQLYPEFTMRHVRGVQLLGLLAAAVIEPLGAQAASPVTELPRDLEIRLVRAALPAHLREGATIYTFSNARGYEVAVRGTNGFHALVGRDDPALRHGEWAFDRYADDFLIPISFDAAGSETHLRTYLDLGAWRAGGVPAREAKQRLRDGFADGSYRAPSRPGIAYMLSPIVRAYQSAERSDRVAMFSLPHYMFYAPGMTAHDIGASATLAHPTMIAERADPHGLIIVLAGEKERAAFRAEHQEILDRLCELNARWCFGGR